MRASEHLKAAREALLVEIERFCAERKISESTFGGMAVNDGKFVARLRSEDTMTDRLIKRAESFIRERKVKRPPAEAERSEVA